MLASAYQIILSVAIVLHAELGPKESFPGSYLVLDKEEVKNIDEPCVF